MRLFASADASTDSVQQPSSASASARAFGAMHDTFTIVGLDCLTCAGGSRGTRTFAVARVTTTSTGLGTGLHVFSLSFAFGVPIDLQWQSTLAAGAGASSSGNEPHFAGQASSLADFSSTFAWAGIQSILDQNGVSVSRFTALNGSGVDYADSFASAVPEPDTLALLLSGMVAVATLAKRRNRAGSSH